MQDDPVEPEIATNPGMDIQEPRPYPQKKKPTKKPFRQEMPYQYPQPQPIQSPKKNPLLEGNNLLLAGAVIIIMCLFLWITANNDLSAKSNQLNDITRSYNASQSIISTMATEKTNSDTQLATCQSNQNGYTLQLTQRSSDLSLCNNQTNNVQNLLNTCTTDKNTVNSQLTDCKISNGIYQTRVDSANANISTALTISDLKHQIHLLQLNANLSQLDYYQTILNTTTVNLNQTLTNYGKDYCCTLNSNLTSTYYYLNGNKVVCTGTAVSTYNITC